jgi:hypothetical protein
MTNYHHKMANFRRTKIVSKVSKNRKGCEIEALDQMEFQHKATEGQRQPES